MTPEEIKERKAVLHKKIVELRKEIVNCNKPLSMLEGRLSTAERRLSIAIARANNNPIAKNKDYHMKCEQHYNEVHPLYMAMREKRDKLVQQRDKLIKEDRKYDFILSHLKLCDYIRDCNNIVRDILIDRRPQPARKAEAGEYIFRTVPHFDTIMLDNDTPYKRDTCEKEDFLDLIWRINRQVSFHASEFKWGLCKEIRYKDGQLFFLVDLPCDPIFSASKRRCAAEVDTCLNLDIDWDWIEPCKMMPKDSITVFDKNEDKSLRLQLTEKWLDRTPAELDYREYLEEEAARRKEMLAKAKKAERPYKTNIKFN